MSDSEWDKFVKIPMFRESSIISMACEIKPRIDRHLRVPDSDIKDLVSELGRLLNINTRMGRIALLLSIQSELKQSLSDVDVLRMSYRLSANKETIASGRAADYSPQLVPLHWAVSEVCRLEKSTNSRGRKVLSVTFKILSGPLAGRRYVHQSSWKWGKYLWGLATGFPMKCRYLSPKQLFGFRYGLRLCLYNEDMQCKEWGVSKSLRAKNTKLARSRVRAISPCPFKKQIDCIACSATRKDCSLAVIGNKTPAEKSKDG